MYYYKNIVLIVQCFYNNITYANDLLNKSFAFSQYRIGYT